MLKFKRMAHYVWSNTNYNKRLANLISIYIEQYGIIQIKGWGIYGRKELQTKANEYAN